MNKQAPRAPHRYLWRLVFLLFMVIPFLPEIVIVVTAAVADIMGWNQKGACTFGSLPVTRIITFALEAGASSILAFVRNDSSWLMVFYAGVSAWLSICLVTACLAWTSVPSRLLVGFAAAVVVAVLPYLGPMLAISNLTNDDCRPNEAGVGACVMFGGYIGDPAHSPAHDAVTIGWLAVYGIPLAFGIFGIYAIVVIVAWVMSRKRALAT